MSQDEVAGSEGGGSSKVFLVLGLLAGVALGGGLSYYYFNTQVPASEEEAREVKPKGPVHSIRFERIAVPIYLTSGNSRRFIGNYFIDLAVEVRGDDNQITIRRSETQLQHAFIAAISQNDLMREDSPLELDHEKVSSVLKARANSVLGSNIVQNVAILNSMRLSN
ncbi:MAG: hypothetical protein HWE25_08090 [Alphaproteobacteria bacterium]|nr:hypothetical protein [Alphaproteobacteria bacterium]